MTRVSPAGPEKLLFIALQDLSPWRLSSDTRALFLVSFHPLTLAHSRPFLLPQKGSFVRLILLLLQTSTPMFPLREAFFDTSIPTPPLGSGPFSLLPSHPLPGAAQRPTLSAGVSLALSAEHRVGEQV